MKKCQLNNYLSDTFFIYSENMSYKQVFSSNGMKCEHRRETKN